MEMRWDEIMGQWVGGCEDCRREGKGKGEGEGRIFGVGRGGSGGGRLCGDEMSEIEGV